VLLLLLLLLSETQWLFLHMGIQGRPRHAADFF
jgi:hypothetical protein